MTTLRSSWPSRLRQLLSNEGAIGPSVKLETEPIGHDQSNYRIGTTLYFELHAPSAQSKEQSAEAVSTGTTVIHMPDLHLCKEDDLSLMKQCIEQYSIPSELRFSLLTRIRYARAFRSPRICRLYSRICLLAFIVLVQSGDAQDELVSFFANEPEYTNELIRIVRSEEVVSGSIRTLAMLALGAQLAACTSSHHRARILSGSNLTFAGGNRMILLNVLQRAILSLKSSNDPSSLAFVEALLQFYLLHVVSTSTSANNIRGSGMVPTFLPLLEDFDPTHIHLVCFAVKTLQKLMDYSSSSVSLFRELGGIELLTQRLQKEVHRVIGLVGEIDSMMLTGESFRHNPDQLHSQKRLIKVSLKALGSATYAPANSTRSQHSHDSSLPTTLSLIFQNVYKFGGDIYYSAVTVMSEIIHKDPTCFSALHEMGLPNAFLLSVGSDILPSSKALTCIPNGLGAICLNAKGLEAVRESSSLRFLVDIFTSKKYVLAMNEAIVPLANAVEELLRHVSSLRSTGVDIIIEIIHKIASFGDGKIIGSSGKAESTAMETDSKNKENEGHCCIVGTSSSAVEGIGDEQFIQLCVFHLMVLVQRTIENGETCRLFVEKLGIEALLKLLLRPSIAQSSDGMSIALHSTMVFKGFAQHHSIPLARAFCSSLRVHLKKALEGLGATSEPLLLDPRMSSDGGFFSSLFVVEFLLFLATSKDNRWVTALLTEFGNGSKDVLEDIGLVHREVLWQIALLENRKPEDDEDGIYSSNSQQAEGDASESEEQRFNSFRQFLDPLLRRRTPGWSIESQFFNLINLYRDLGRSPGSQHRSISIGPSNMRSSSSNQVQHSGSDDTSETAHKKESDKQRPYYTSCCDMVRSLSFHISHLFQELGKVMLLPSRRRDDVVNVSPASKSVASTFATIAFDHMNYGGRCVNLSGTEESISTKCRYFGKVIDFMDNILMERLDSCNPILLNCLYGRGVIGIVLTTFEATSQLLFTVNRAPASPMDTDDANAKQDDKEDSDSWIYGSLASYGKLMDHLVTSSFILSSFTKHLLAQPLTNGDTPFPRDAETFVKVLQSRVMKTVIPVWTHPQFVDCSYEFISTVISIIKHVYTGIEVKNVNGSGGARITGPPPNETTISTIIEMGFTRSRAEEALRQVGSNSVELAMEWLFSHPEETQEDDELARALAMSLGNSESDSKDAAAKDNTQHLEEEMVQLPPVDELLSTCTKLLSKDPLAFPVRDLLVMICSQDDGQHRTNVVSFIVERIKECGLVSNNGNYAILAALFHVLALILNEDSLAREAASKSGMIKITSDLLFQWDSSLDSREKQQIPKWVTAAFLALDRLLQVDQKLNSEITEQLKKEPVNNQQVSITIDEDRQNRLQSACGLGMKYTDIHEHKRLVEIACSCMKNQLPSDTMHAVLLLCSNLTRNHSVALTFLDAGGLSLLLSLPTSSLFPGFDNVAASIVRHVLEDPQTLQQAMESEIKHSLVVASNRHPNGRVNPHNFLSNLASVVSRDPSTFMLAAQSVCQVEMVGERPYIVLLKDKDKDKAKEKDKVQNSDGKVSLGNTTSPAINGKIHDSNTKSAKGHKKPSQSFVNVIELLLESICTFVPPLKDDIASNALPGTAASTDMEIDVSLAKGKGKGKAVANMSEDNETGSQDASASLAKTVFILKLLTEILLMYSSSVHVLLRRDAEMSSIRGSYQKSPAGLSMGGIFYHILHNFLPYSRNSKKDKKVDGDWRQKLATRANQFLVAACVRSTEARKRVFNEISYIINEFVDLCHGIRSPGNEVQVFVDLLNDVLAARTPAGSSISAEATTTFIDSGLVKPFTCTLQVLDLDHPDSSEVATGIIKALELVTKEHVHSVDSSKGDISAKPSVLSQPGRTNNIGEISQSMETTSQANPDSLQVDHVRSYAVRSYGGGSEAVTDDMEHDQDLDGSFAPGNEDDYMHENSEDARDLENGMENVGLQDNSFANEAFHVMPLEVFGSRRPGRTTSIYSLLGRTGDTALPSRHPLLLEPSSFPPLTGQSGYSLENNSVGLDNIFRSLRSGRQAQRLHLWTDNYQQSGGTSAVVVPQGLEELLVNQLRRPSAEKSSNQNIAEAGSHAKVGITQAQDAGGAMPDVPVESNPILEVSTITPSVIDNSNNVDARPIGTGPSQANVLSTQSQAVEMQFEHNDGNVRDVEAVSQESSGSGATFGESLRSLDVEIGSADGHDDGAERQVSADRIAGDSQAARTRRANIPLTQFSPVVGRDASLHSVTEVSENSSHDADQDGPAAAEQPVNSDAGSGAIDPAFLDALPEELRAEVLSAQQGQAAQPSNVESQNTGDIDPEFLAALPADIRAEVLAQQQAQRLHQSPELEGQPVLLTSPDTILANLTPALVAEANMLRERFAHRYSRTMFGMYPRSRRGETSRREGVGSGLDAAGGTISSRRSGGAKVVEADGAPLVDTEALHAMIRLFRVVQFRLPHPAIKEPVDERGKAVIVGEGEENISESNEGYISIAMLLGLLNQPLYLRSIAHLEQLLNLLDVIIDSAGNKSSDKSLISTTLPSGPQISAVEADVNADSNILSPRDDTSTDVEGSSKPTSSGHNVECDSHGVLSNLRKVELRLLCSLLAQEGLSDNAYTLVAEVMRKLVAIAPNHCELFVTELAEAVQKLTSSAMNELHVFGEAMKSLLSTTSTDGASILRVLQALSSLVTLLTGKENDKGIPALSEVWEINSALEPLWHELSCCISKIEFYSESASESLTSSSTFVSKPSGVMSPLPAGSQNILPYIESFFVVCEKLHPAQPGASHESSIPVISDVEYASTSAPQKASGTSAKVDEKHAAFVRFSEKHRKLLNSFIRQNPGLLEKSFSLMLKVPRFIDFDNKRAHFRSKIKHQHDHHHSPLRISVRRAYVLEDSYNQLRMRSTQDLKGRLTVHFQGEEGIDAGGLTREWYQLLSRVIFDKGALLFTTVGNESTFQPNPNSVYQTEHLSYFKFVGRVVGKALFDGQLLDVHFTRSFYKHILGNDISDVLDLTFSIDADEEKLILYERNEVTDYELIAGGRNIKVTEENKHQYVDLVAEHRLTTAIRPQINSFLEGFNELIPRELISIFNDKELELLISGLPDIDFKSESIEISCFRVPLDGFSALQGISGSQKFQIHKAYGSPDHLPSAHTCFNQLDLPEYPSKQHLEERLLLAVHEGSEGFGFG
ncbi:E3 ubiquitin-protein [Vigna angularis]|uniref:HECT-type E3 ubiquitin transferase n=1 Tax=Phaseolus angularis TaxID=3914 RepID=A0A8T0K4S5_PHAAN|nr:E3 ubiquitin-protein [Vigna angularis]